VQQLRLGARRPDYQENEWNDHQRELDEGEDNDGGGLRRGGRLPGDQLVQHGDIAGARRVGHRADQHGDAEPGLADEPLLPAFPFGGCPSAAGGGCPPPTVQAAGRDQRADDQQRHPRARSSPALA
jgi:hypothetical protein